MRTSVCVVLLLATTTFAAPKKKNPPAKATAGKPAVVVDAPPPMARVLQASFGGRFAVTVNGNALSDAPTAKEVRAVTTPAGAVAVVLARSAGDSWSLTVLNGADGTPLDNQVFRTAARKPLKGLPKDVEAALLAAVATGQAPGGEPAAAPTPSPSPKAEPVAAKPEPTPAAQPTPAPPPSTPAEPSASTSATAVSSEPSTPSGPSKWPALRAGLGFRGFGRTLTWAGDPTNSLAKYELPFAPAVTIDAAWYPAAHFTSGFVANLGLAFTGDVVVGLSSRLKEGDASRYGTRVDRFRMSGAFRLPFGEVFSVEVNAGASVQRFAIDPVAANTGGARPAIPSVAFVGPRGAVGVRLMKLGPVGVDAMGGFTFLTSTGELGTDAYFRRARGFGVDVGAGVSYALLENIHVRASFDWTRYFLTLNPVDGATFTSTAAADQYLGGAVSLQWVM